MLWKATRAQIILSQAPDVQCGTVGFGVCVNRFDLLWPELTLLQYYSFPLDGNAYSVGLFIRSV